MNWLNNLWNKATNTFDKWVDVEVGRYEAKRSYSPTSSGGDPFGGAVPPSTTTTGGIDGNVLAWVVLAALAAFLVLKK